MKVQFTKHYRKQFNPLNFRLFLYFNSTGFTKCLHLSFIFMSMAHKWWQIRHSPLWYWLCVCQYLSVQRVMNPRWCVVLQKTQRSMDDVDWLKSGLEQEKGQQEKFPQLEEIWESCPAQVQPGTCNHIVCFQEWACVWSRLPCVPHEERKLVTPHTF